MATSDVTNTYELRPIYSICSNIESNSPRRLKKRETDRRCQREARERTKARIAYLEEQVKVFLYHNATSQVAVLSQRLRDMETERDQLLQAFYALQSTSDTQQLFVTRDKVPCIIPLTDAMLSNETDGGNGTRIVNPRLDLFETEIALSNSFPQTSLDRWQIAVKCGENADFYRDQSSHSVKIYSRLSADSKPWIHDSHTNSQGRHSCIQGVNLWRFACDVLDELFSWPEGVQAADDIDCDDVPIRALLQGWQAVRRQQLHPTWMLLSRIDEGIFQPIPRTERVAMLKIMHLLLQFHLQPSFERFTQLPLWYRHRPSQGLPHTYAIDFVVWPEFRELFILNEYAYGANDFWYSLQRNIKILWPYSIEDCFTYDTRTGLFRVTSMFNETIRNINCWAMQPEFSRFPELSNQIPRYDRILRPTLNSTPTG